MNCTIILNMRMTPRGYVPQTSNTMHTATMPSGDAYTCACARRADHLVKRSEVGGTWQDTHPTLF